MTAPAYEPCCEHCECDPWPSVGHLERCPEGCNLPGVVRRTPELEPAEEGA